jgi:predicted dehydrogenase
MKKTPLTRRTFLKHSALAAAGAALSARSWSQVTGANTDIRLAIIGVGGPGGGGLPQSRGRAHLKGYAPLKGVRIVALCDVDSEHLEGGAKTLPNEGRGIDRVIDWRELLTRKDIDAVSIATPNHQHAIQAIWACQAGKDVYVEKPVSHTLWEGRQLVAAAQKYQRVVQSGTQSRSSRALIEAVEWVRAGNIGKIVSVRGLCYKRRPSIGKTVGPQPVPATVNYDLWAGPAPLAPVRRKNFHYDWHWQWATGNGDLGNQGCHQMDIARWFLGADTIAPHTLSVGGRVGYEDDGETPNTLVLVHEYANAPLIFEVRGLPHSAGETKMDELKGASIGVIVTCEGGTVVVGAGRGGPRAFDRAGKELKQFAGGDGEAEGGGHFQNFLSVVRSRKLADLRCRIEEGRISTALSHTANISYRLGRKSSPDAIREKIKGDANLSESFGRMMEHLAANQVDTGRTPLSLGVPLRFDSLTDRFVGNEDANALLTREYRKPFVIPALA